jgi:hypothetical protein
MGMLSTKQNENTSKKNLPSLRSPRAKLAATKLEMKSTIRLEFKIFGEATAMQKEKMISSNKSMT